MNIDSQESSGAQSKSVLIVDSDEKLSQLLRTCFQTIGLNVFSASNAEQAQELAQEKNPDLLVLDADTPLNQSKSYLEHLDQEEPTHRTPAIVLCKSKDLRSIVHPATFCTYYVHKCGSAWDRIETFTNELIDLSPSPSNQTSNS